VLFDDPGVTKAELAGYYAGVADVLLPHVADRPLSLQVFPSGISRPGHFMKNVPSYFPDWIGRAKLPKRGGTVTHPVVSSADGLRMLVQHNAITLHAPTARLDRLDRPDRFVVDFDPSGGDDAFADVVRGAGLAGRLLRDAGLEPFAMTTGSRGFHVVAPIQRRQDFDDVRRFMRDVAAEAARRHPGALTTEQRKAKRESRIFLDVMRNTYAHTTVAPYAVRARPGAPVATPLRWEELEDRDTRPDGWTLHTLPERLERLGDPWRDMRDAARPLGAARRRLRVSS
jgi:bifunctional non-homologous end joining protein LigD